MLTSTLSAVDAQTGTKVPLATFTDANGNTVVGHVTLAGSPLAPVSPGNPVPVADGALATAVASLASELAGVATSAGQASAQTALGDILAKLDAVGVSGTVTVQDSSAEASLAALATISGSASGVAAAAGTPGDAAWNGSGDGSLVAVGKAAVAAAQSVASRLGTKLSVQQTDPLPAGTNAIGTVGVTGIVTVQDSAAETNLAAIVANTGASATAANQAISIAQEAAIATAAGTQGDAAWSGTGNGSLISLLKSLCGKLAGTLTTTLTGPLPAGTNALGSISVSNLPASQTVSGAVSVSNFPTTQPISGSVGVTSLPALPAGLNTIGNVGVTGTVAVQDSAAEAALAAVQTALTGVLRARISDGINNAAITSQGSLAVSGQTAVGSPPTSPPLAISGVDGSGNKQHLRTDSNGVVQVAQAVPLPAGTNAIGTVGVTGTVAVQDSAAETNLAAIATTLTGTLLVQQNAPLPAGSNTIGGVSARNGVTLTQTVVNVAAGTDAQLLGANPNRKSCGFFLVTSGVVGYLNLGAAATSANGLPFGQGSQFGYAYTWEGSGVPTNALHLMSPSNATVVVWEGV